MINSVFIRFLHLSLEFFSDKNKIEILQKICVTSDGDGGWIGLECDGSLESSINLIYSTYFMTQLCCEITFLNLRRLI